MKRWRNYLQEISIPIRLRYGSIFPKSKIFTERNLQLLPTLKQETFFLFLHYNNCFLYSQFICWITTWYDGECGDDHVPSKVSFPLSFTLLFVDQVSFSVLYQVPKETKSYKKAIWSNRWPNIKLYFFFWFRKLLILSNLIPTWTSRRFSVMWHKV